MKTGIYFSHTENEVMSVTEADARLGPEWLHVSDESRLGLLAIRRLLAEDSLVADPNVVYWFMPQPVAETPALGCDAPSTRPDHRGPLARLRTALRGARSPTRLSPR